MADANADAKRALGDFILSLGKGEDPMAKRKATASAPGFTSGDLGLQPMALTLYAVPGWGKTSTAAYAKDPALIMAEEETGYETLLGAGRVPDIPRATVSNWRELICQVNAVADADQPPCSVLGLDAIGAFEAYCHDYVARRSFGGERSKFEAYRQGYREAANTAWGDLFASLDRVKANGVSVLILAHHRVKKTRDPMTEEYSRSTFDVEKESVPRVKRWSDAILYGTYKVTTPDDGDGPVEGGRERVLYCENHAAHDAKNRFGMPERIRMPDDPSQNWQVIRDAIVSEGDDE